MHKSYQDPQAGGEYKDFSNSMDGQQQHELVFRTIINLLTYQATNTILDAGCGTGWLTNKLAEHYGYCEGCDISEILLQQAQKNYPNLHFKLADVTQELPYVAENFDVVILNMVLHNIEQQKTIFEKVAKVLRPKGVILVISVNPYYTFPVGVWKRSILDFILRHKPSLRLNDYNSFLGANRNYTWANKIIPGRFSPLSEQIQAGVDAGLRLTHMKDLKYENDSSIFDFNYRLHRFPLLVLLKFEKN